MSELEEILGNPDGWSRAHIGGSQGESLTFVICPLCSAAIVVHGWPSWPARIHKQWHLDLNKAKCPDNGQIS